MSTIIGNSNINRNTAVDEQQQAINGDLLNLAEQIQVLEHPDRQRSVAMPRLVTSEPGHAPAQTPEQRLFESQFTRYEAAMEKYEAALTKHEGANARNAEIDRANEPKKKEAEFFDEMREALLKVTSHAVAGDTYVSRQELTDLLGSSDPAQRKAAEFLLANWDRVPAPKYGAWGGGMNANEMRQSAATMGKEAQSRRDQLQPHVPVPPHPGAPPPPPAAPGAPQSTSHASTAANNPGTSNTSDASKSTGTDKPNGATPAEFDAAAMPGYSKYGPFSSTATTGEGRIQDGVQYIQGGIDVLEQDLAAAASRGDQAAITRINSQIQKLQAGMSALMQMLKQRHEMESNMHKMFSEMAMSSIRNMR